MSSSSERKWSKRRKNTKEKKHIIILKLKEYSANTILQILVSKRFSMLYPNLETALRICLYILYTNTSEERSLSVFKDVKNYLRYSIFNDHLSVLAFFLANKNLVNAISYD